MNDNQITNDTLNRLKARAAEQGCSSDDLLNRLLDSMPPTPLPPDLFKQLVENTNDAIFVFDTDLRYRYVSPAFALFTALDPAHVIGKTDHDLGMSEALIALWKISWQHLIETRQQQVTTFEYTTPQGPRFLESQMNLLLDEDGAVQYLFAIVRDVSKRVQNEDMLNNIANRLPGMVLRYRLYPDGKEEVPFVSAGAEQLYEVTAKEVMADLSIIWAKIHRDDISNVAASIQASSTDLSLWDYEWRAVMDDGTIKWINGRGTPRRLEDGSTLWNTLLLDITERKQAEQDLRQSEKTYRLLFEESPIALWKQDFSQTKRYLDSLIASGVSDIQAYLEGHPEIVTACLALVNLREVNHTGLVAYNAESLNENEAIEKLSSIIEADSSQPASLAAVARGEKTFIGEFTNYTLSGDVRRVLIKWVVMPGYETTYEQVLVASMDITEQARAENLRLEQERLKASLKKEQEFNASVQKAISALAHDLRTPLTMIASSKELLSHYFDRLSESQRQERLDNIGRQLKFALEVLDDTVSLVRGSLNERVFNPTDVNLVVLCKLTIDEMREIARDNHRFLLVNQKGIENALLDEILVTRILLNLISNALKYSPNGGEIRLELDQQNGWIILRVQDKGMGISVGDLPHIFEPFYRAEEAHTMSGSGLGLSIVKECVDRHHGRITVESMIGQGTTFTVELPSSAGKSAVQLM